MNLTSNRLARSLQDRVLGGVCGGLGAYLGIGAWWVRLTLAALTALSGGVAALLYVLLWWTMPLDLQPDAPRAGRDIGMLLLVGGLTALTGLVVLARGLGLLTGPGGVDLFWPLVVVIVGAALVWQQVRGR